MAKSNKATKKVEEKPVKVQEPSSDEASSDSDASDASDNASFQSAEESGSDQEESDASESNKRAASDDSDDDEEEETKPEPKRAKVEISREEKPQFGSDGLSLFVGQLDWNCTEDELRAFFEDNGKTVTTVRMSVDRNADQGVKRNRGFGYVDFANAADVAAARELNGVEFQGRNIRIDDATPAPRRQKDENYSPRTSTVFVANIARSLDEAGLREAFESFGTINEVRLPIDRETEQIRGFGYVQFETEEQAEKAVKDMNGVSLNGRPIRTDFSGGPGSERQSTGGRGGRGGRGK
jgi:nucleolin